jgi:hypothetical protein
MGVRRVAICSKHEAIPCRQLAVAWLLQLTRCFTAFPPTRTSPAQAAAALLGAAAAIYFHATVAGGSGCCGTHESALVHGVDVGVGAARNIADVHS